MKNSMMISAVLMISGSAMASDLGKQLVSCEFGNVKISYQQLDFSETPQINGYLYDTKISQVVNGVEQVSTSVAAALEYRKSVEITSTEDINTVITVKTKRYLESKDGLISFSAERNLNGMRSSGTCTFTE